MNLNIYKTPKKNSRKVVYMYIFTDQDGLSNTDDTDTVSNQKATELSVEIGDLVLVVDDNSSEK